MCVLNRGILPIFIWKPTTDEPRIGNRLPLEGSIELYWHSSACKMASQPSPRFFRGVLAANYDRVSGESKYGLVKSRQQIRPLHSEKGGKKSLPACSGLHYHKQWWLVMTNSTVWQNWNSFNVFRQKCLFSYWFLFGEQRKCRIFL